MKGLESASNPETFFAADRRAWRAWLAAHHALKKEIWLVLFKKHVNKECIDYEAAVEEALCFGWIDGKTKRVDDERHMFRFTPRNPKSIWSESNKRRARKLIKEGRMTDAGLALIKAAKKSGQWQKAYERENMEVVPLDLEAALARSEKARENFHQFAPSYRKLYIAWIIDAKREETRRQRIQKVVRRARENKKPGIDM